MKTENFNLNKIIDFTKWQKLQDSLALVTKMAMITIDYKGNPVVKHSMCNRFCEIVRADKEQSKYCQKCDSRGGLEAVCLNEPYIYLCHYNIVEIAIPIIIDGKYIGAIMAGQVKLSDTNANEILEQVARASNKALAKQTLEDLKEYYDELPVLSYEEVKNNANMLFSLCSYIVEESLDKNLISEMYQNSINGDRQIDSNILEGYHIKNIENVKREISNAVINAYVTEKPVDNSDIISVSTTLKPAIDYIYKNKSENISMEKMANLCHISPSYFSRLFVKECGDNFSTYLSRLKIKWAKSLLEETDMHITEISEELGFSESGYFIKIFKKHECVTPHLYRKYYKDERPNRI